MTRVEHRSQKDDHGTPWPFYNRLDGEFSFDLDPCALADTAKCHRYFAPPVDHFTHPMDRVTSVRWEGTIDQSMGTSGLIGFDGLECSWGGHQVFCNPPYGRGITSKWVDKAIEEGRKTLVVMLLPARPSTRWWARAVESCQEVRFVRGRIKFQGAESGAPFPSAVLVWDPYSQIADRRRWLGVSGPKHSYMDARVK